MDRQKAKQARRSRRRIGIRKRIHGTAEVPRLSVYRSLRHVYAQLVNDLDGTTICAASTMDKGFTGQATGNVQAAREVGRLLAERARAKGIEKVVFDRGGFRYHGRVRALADAAREGGLKF
ncbi:MAG: 50S ribosomal protein L18 [Phycisphaerales bacterium]|nr:MAG: 50S ribosomal protein L18 [Phycisphaerales bacterium]